MAIVYQYNKDGYFISEAEDYALLPNNATYDPVTIQDGYWPRRVKLGWVQVENHKGREGYVHGEACTIKEYGELPEGWSDMPPPLTLEEVRTAKLTEINNGYSSVMAYIQAGYPLDEVLSWERQASQARELLVNPDASAVFVRVLADQKGISVGEMRDRILRNATNWEPIAALLTAQRQIMEESAYMAQTIADVENIKVGYSV